MKGTLYNTLLGVASASSSSSSSSYTTFVDRVL